MVHARALTSRLDELLSPAAFDDLGPNGLQVPGADEVRRIVTGVTAQRELIERAINGVELPAYAGAPDSGTPAEPSTAP